MNGRRASSIHPSEIQSYNSNQVAKWLCEVGYRDHTAGFLDRNINGKKLLSMKQFELKFYFGRDNNLANQFWNMLEALRNNDGTGVQQSPSENGFGRSRPAPPPNHGGPPFGGGMGRHRQPLPPPIQPGYHEDPNADYIHNAHISSRPALPIPFGNPPFPPTHRPPVMPPTEANPTLGQHWTPDSLDSSDQEAYLSFDKPPPMPPLLPSPPAAGIKQKKHIPSYDDHALPNRPPPQPPRPQERSRSSKSVEENSGFSLADELKSRFKNANPYIVENPNDLTKDLPPPPVSIPSPPSGPVYPVLPNSPAKNVDITSHFSSLSTTGSSLSRTPSDNVFSPTEISNDLTTPSSVFSPGKSNYFPTSLHNQHLSDEFPLPPPPLPISNDFPPPRPPKSIHILRQQSDSFSDETCYEHMAGSTDFSRPTEEQPWFMNTSRDGAQRAIESNKQTGIFIIRPRNESSSQPYALTLFANGSFKNLVIRKKPNGEYALGSEKPNELSFKNVVLLVDYYQRNELNIADSSAITLVSGP